MKPFNKSLYLSCQLFQVVCKICSKWFTGALLQKLILEGFRKAGTPVSSSSDLFKVVFLQDQNFDFVLVLLVATTSVQNVSRASLQYLSQPKGLAYWPKH